MFLGGKVRGKCGGGREEIQKSHKFVMDATCKWNNIIGECEMQIFLFEVYGAKWV